MAQSQPGEKRYKLEYFDGQQWHEFDEDSVLTRAANHCRQLYEHNAEARAVRINDSANDGYFDQKYIFDQAKSGK